MADENKKVQPEDVKKAMQEIADIKEQVTEGSEMKKEENKDVKKDETKKQATNEAVDETIQAAKEFADDATEKAKEMYEAALPHAKKAKEKLGKWAKFAYNHPKFKDFVVVFGVLIYLLLFFNINHFLMGYFNIGHFDWNAPKFGFSEMGWGDFFVLALVAIPLLMIGTLTKASFYNLAPKSWASTKNRYGIETMREHEELKEAGFIGKTWIYLKRFYRFMVLVFMIVFSPMLPFWAVWLLLASYLYFNTEFFTFWRLVLLTMPAVIAYDRLWVNINWWATKRRNTDIGGAPEGDNSDVVDE